MPVKVSPTHLLSREASMAGFAFESLRGDSMKEDEADTVSTFTKSRLLEKTARQSFEIPNTCSQPNHTGQFVLLCEDFQNIFPSVNSGSGTQKRRITMMMMMAVLLRVRKF